MQYAQGHQSSLVFTEYPEVSEDLKAALKTIEENFPISDAKVELLEHLPTMEISNQIKIEVAKANQQDNHKRGSHQARNL